jgi:hypothetical protein
MKFMYPAKRLAWFTLTLAFALTLTAGSISAQKRKSSTAKKPAPTRKADVKKQTAKSKDARNTRTASKSKTPARDKKAAAKDTRSKKQTNARASRNDPKAKKLSAREQAKLDARDKKSRSKASREAERRAAAERRAEAERRRQAALAEQRRREQLAREARARKLAFERGLKTETQENIAHDITEGEDLRIRKAAVEGLGGRAGTVVVMESQTGKVLTMVNQDWAIRNSFKPCSTIKLVTGVAGINENVINGDGTVSGSASSINLNTALAYSKNPYFQRVGVKVGNGKMIEYARDLGLGQKTGINAEGETPGRLPYGNSNPRIYSHGDDFEVTPLQLAVMVSALSNDGKKVVPHIQKPQIERAGYRPQFSGKISVSQDRYQGVLPGMMGAAEYGTARKGVDHSLGIAGKTGSCISKGSWVGLFASVAPVENPKYAVVVITRGERERGKYAAAVAGHIYRALAQRITRDHNRYMALKNRSGGAPLDSRTAAAEDGEEDEDVEIAASDDEDRKAIAAVPTVKQQVPVVPDPKKGVVKTAQSMPVLSPVVIPYRKDGLPLETPPAAQQRPRIVKNEK